MRKHTHHSSDVTQALQILHYTALMRRLHPGKAPRCATGLTLQVGRQLIEFPPRQAPVDPRTLLLLLLLCDDSHPPTDGQSCPLIVTCDVGKWLDWFVKNVVEHSRFSQEFRLMFEVLRNNGPVQNCY